MLVVIRIWAFFLLIGIQAAQATVLEVIAVEYPPYTTPTRSDDGLVFHELRTWLSARKLPFTIKARFLPPARAQHAVDTGDWCVALYPPSASTPHVYRQIGDAKIVIGLVRRKEEEPFVWSSPEEFRGKRIALLRSSTLSDFWMPFEKAGAEFTFVETMEQALGMLVRTRVDYAAADRAGLEEFRKTFPEGRELEFSEKGIQEYPLRVFLSERCRDLLGPEEERGADEDTAPLQN
ncbi:hypothetical protein [Roseibium sp. M-1]